MRAPVVLGAATLAGVLGLATSMAYADAPSTAAFVVTCKRDAAGCKETLSEIVIDNGSSCVPNLDQVLTEIGQHPEWSDQPWSGSVDAAIKAICARPH